MSTFAIIGLALLGVVVLFLVIAVLSKVVVRGMRGPLEARNAPIYWPTRP